MEASEEEIVSCTRRPCCLAYMSGGHLRLGWMVISPPENRLGLQAHARSVGRDAGHSGASVPGAVLTTEGWDLQDGSRLPGSSAGSQQHQAPSAYGRN